MYKLLTNHAHARSALVYGFLTLINSINSTDDDYDYTLKKRKEDKKWNSLLTKKNY